MYQHALFGAAAVGLVPMLALVVLAVLHLAAMPPLGGLLPYLQHLQGELGTNLPLVPSRCLSAPPPSAILLWLLPAALKYA